MAIGVPILGTPDQATAASSNDSLPSWPATNPGDLELLLAATSSGSETIITTPDGWTLDAQHSCNVDTQAPSVFGAHLTAAGDETGTQAVAHGSTVASVAIVDVPGGEIASVTPFDLPTGTKTWTIPTVTVEDDNSTLIFVASGNNTTSTWEPPAGWTELWDGVQQEASTRAWSIVYKQNVPAGSAGGDTLTISNTSRGVGILYVVRPLAVVQNAYHVWDGTQWVEALEVHTWDGAAWV